MDLFRLLRRPAAPASSHPPRPGPPPETGPETRPETGAETRVETDPETGQKRLSLGLQGGGAHGAFEWGVLDRLLEDDRIRICAVTAASAGAMNAVALAAGLAGARPGE